MILIDLIKEFALTKNPYKQENKSYLLKKGLAYLTYIPLTKYYKVTRRDKTFIYQGREYNYFYDLYNATFRNERAIEIPIIMWLLVKMPLAKTLEVGNVLSHYYPVEHDVIDKYELLDNVINEDIATFKPETKYDLVISISTLEHVGWDEKREPHKLINALRNIQQNILKPNGVMFATVPIGYNDNLDQLLKYDSDVLSSIHCMWRENHRSKDWIEVEFTPKLIKDCVDIDVNYHEVVDGYGSTLIAVLEMRNEIDKMANNKLSAKQIL